MIESSDPCYFKLEKVLLKSSEYHPDLQTFSLEVVPNLKKGKCETKNGDNIIDENKDSEYFICIGGDNFVSVYSSSLKKLKMVTYQGYWFYTLLPVPGHHLFCYIYDYYFYAMDFSDFQIERIGDGKEFQTVDSKYTDVFTINKDKWAYINYDSSAVNVLDYPERKVERVYKRPKSPLSLHVYKKEKQKRTFLLIGALEVVRVIEYHNNNNNNKKKDDDDDGDQTTYRMIRLKDNFSAASMCVLKETLLVGTERGRVFEYPYFLEKPSSINNNNIGRVILFLPDSIPGNGTILGYKDIFSMTSWNGYYLMYSDIIQPKDLEENQHISDNILEDQDDKTKSRNNNNIISDDDEKMEKMCLRPIHTAEVHQKNLSEEMSRRGKSNSNFFNHMNQQLFRVQEDQKRNRQSEPMIRTIRWVNSKRKKYVIGLSTYSGLYLYRNTTYVHVPQMFEVDRKERREFLFDEDQQGIVTKECKMVIKLRGAFDHHLVCLRILLI